ncbi:MAG: M14 family zinc carboxypeptidase [Nocardiopsaceae bacterium]|nr:M14 family zinc carboxypeptidase [Nocardiopsaceae bacterium]
MSNRSMAELIGEPANFTTFLGVDALVDRMHRIAAAHPDAVAVREIGRSRLGDPLWSMTIGNGPRHALVFGGVHPNEPVGGLTALHLAQTLADDGALRADLGYTWHIIPCIDPDGTRLNEAWFTGPMSRSHYGRNFYRPAGDEQVEWSFPLSYKKAVFTRAMPETRALMHLIDKVTPAFMASLHNGEYGGVFYYVSHTTPALTEQLTQIPAAFGLPLETGEGEAPFIERFAPAIFGCIRAEDAYDFAESHGMDPLAHVSGASSAAYAERYGTFYLASEVPYWADPDADDHTPIDQSYADLLRARGAEIGEVAQLIQEVLDELSGDFSVASPFLRATRAFAPHLSGLAAQNATRAAAPENQRPAVVCERMSGIATVEAARLRYAGMLLRALDGEIAIGNRTPGIRRQHARLRERYQGWAADADAVPVMPIPINDLVGVQYAAVIACARHVGG